MARYTNLDDIIAKLDKDIEDHDKMFPAHWIKTWLNMQPIDDVAPKIEWISVDERLPEREGKYLVYTYKGGIKFGEYRSYLVGEGALCEPQFDYYVTHWMPLPEPPKKKGGAE